MDSESEVSRVIHAMREGDPEAAGKLLPLVYDELHRLAAANMVRGKPGTLQTTALVHEAYLRLFGSGEQRWENRCHFFGAAAEAMRRILVESARRKGRLKRGGNLRRVGLEEVESGTPDGLEDLLDLNDALDELAADAPETAEVVKLRYFAGLTLEEVSGCLGLSRRTADRYWAYARAWLYDRLGGRSWKGGTRPAGTSGNS